jgi:hypothetical protein
MSKQSRWVRRNIECPEGKGEHDLLIASHDESGKEVVKAISCDNPDLEDFAGGDCEWSCWEEVFEK